MNCYKTDIFKQAIYSFKLNLDLEEINNFCLSFEKNNEGRYASNFGGFQSNDLDFNIPIVNKISSLILDNVNYVSKKYFKLNRSLGISNIWFNINRYKDNNSKHIHPNSLFSGVFYSKVPSNSGSIRFFNSESVEIFFSGLDIMEYTKYNSSSYLLKPEVSLLHIFPSFLNHCVEPNLSNQERISFSFNTNIM
jgi:uncharacterized protein (TIGR02466 family)